MDRILQRLLNQFLGRLMNRAIDTGIFYAARRGKDPADKKARKISRASLKLF